MCPTFISHICSRNRIHIQTSSMHSNYSNLSFYRNTLIDSSIWWMYPIWVEKFETTCKIRLLQIWHDVQDSFTTNVARRARFSDKKLARRARFLLRFTQFELKRSRRRARFFYYKFGTTGKILLLQILLDGQDSLTKNWGDGQDFYYVLPNFSRKVWVEGQDSFTTNLARRARFFYDGYGSTGKILWEKLARQARFFYYIVPNLPCTLFVCEHFFWQDQTRPDMQ